MEDMVVAHDSEKYVEGWGKGYKKGRLDQHRKACEVCCEYCKKGMSVKPDAKGQWFHPDYPGASDCDGLDCWANDLHQAWAKEHP